MSLWRRRPPRGAVDAADLSDPANWRGGTYELAIELGPRDDARLETSLRQLWELLAIEGCFISRGLGHRYNAAEVSLEALGTSALYGAVRLPNGQRTVCVVNAIREDGGPDWLDFGIPLGSLSRVEGMVGGYPFGDDTGFASRRWREPIDTWLAGAAIQLHGVCSFELALVGFDASGEIYAEDIAGVPTERWLGIVTGTSPRFYPATR